MKIIVIGGSGLIGKKLIPLLRGRFLTAAEAGPFTVIADNLAGTAFADTALSNGTTYYYVVSAMVSGQETPDSGARVVRPAGAPQTVSWNLDRYGTLGGALVAGVEPAANWNNSWPGDPRTDLVDSTGTPTTPSLPTVATSTISPSARTVTIETTPVSTK